MLGTLPGTRRTLTTRTLQSVKKPLQFTFKLTFIAESTPRVLPMGLGWVLMFPDPSDNTGMEETPEDHHGIRGRGEWVRSGHSGGFNFLHLLLRHEGGVQAMSHSPVCILLETGVGWRWEGGIL